MKQVSRLFLGLTFLYTILICALGTWWLYLIIQYGEKLASLAAGKDTAKVVTMVKWEGLTFFALLLLLTASLLFLYFKDLKKTKSLQAFFASMTHELKTPLASVKLQGEVLADTVERIDLQKLQSDDSYHGDIHKRMERLSERLVEDANKLETTMDKILQLSRLEGGGNLHLSSIDLSMTFNEVFKRFDKDLELDAQWGHTSKVYADEFALSLIFKNLLENSIIHSEQKKISLRTQEKGDSIQMTYCDHGHFEGDPQKLGNLFYKHNSKNGSGIGLYLTKMLMAKMKGSWSFENKKELTFILQFKKGGLSA